MKPHLQGNGQRWVVPPETQLIEWKVKLPVNEEADLLQAEESKSAASGAGRLGS